MPRAARIDFAGAIQHVTMRGVRRDDIYLDDRDRITFLRRLDEISREYRWRWLSYCLMTNHCHLVLETIEASLGAGMRQFGSRHAQDFNRRHERDGRMFQGRYGSVPVRTDTHFGQLLRYVALNPVKAGLCSEPAEWRWSSHRAFLDGRSEAADARRRVEDLLEAWDPSEGSRYARLFDPAGPLAVRFGAESPWEYRPPLDELLESSSSDRDHAMRIAHDHGYRLAEIGAAVGLHESTVSRRIRKARGAS